MANIIQFVPRAELDARQNLEAFIRLAREELTAFGGKEEWENDRWQEGKTVAVFATKTRKLCSYSFTPLTDPFRQFAKAYVRYAYSHRPVVSVAFWMQALRCIEAAMLDVRMKADISLLAPALMDAAAEKCRKFYKSQDVWHQTGIVMERIYDFCRDKHLVAGLVPWRSPFKKPVILTEDLGEAGKAHRQAKLPSNDAMLALADLFALADDPESRYFSSIAVLLMVAPGRVSEVLRLPIGCIGWDEDEHGGRQMYLRWRAAKGKGPMKKWVIPSMQDVVAEAVWRLTKIGAPARAAAKFAYEHPGEFLRGGGCPSPSEWGDNDAMTPEVFCTAMSIKTSGSLRYEDGRPRWAAVPNRAKWIKQLLANEPVTFAKLAKFVGSRYGGPSWPFIDKFKTIHAWDALCLHRENEFHHNFAVKPFSWRLPSADEVNNRLGRLGSASLFHRYGLKNPDRSEISLTTHQLRHWLSTMAQRAGMDEYTLAQWAGRAHITDNRHYDHRTPEEQLDKARELLAGEKPNLLERFKNRQAVTYRELGIDRPGTAIATLYGMCTHDYAISPCQKQRQCMTCREHVCIKGDAVTLDRIKRLEEQTELLLRRAQQEHEDGAFGADRWVDHHKWKLASTKAMRMALEHPRVPEGTPLRIPEGHDPSPVTRALMQTGVIEPPASDVPSFPVAAKALPPGGRDA